MIAAERVGRKPRPGVLRRVVEIGRFRDERSRDRATPPSHSDAANAKQTRSLIAINPTSGAAAKAGLALYVLPGPARRQQQVAVDGPPVSRWSPPPGRPGSLRGAGRAVPGPRSSAARRAQLPDGVRDSQQPLLLGGRRHRPPPLAARRGPRPRP